MIIMIGGGEEAVEERTMEQTNGSDGKEETVEEKTAKQTSDRIFDFFRARLRIRSQ